MFVVTIFHHSFINDFPFRYWSTPSYIDTFTVQSDEIKHIMVKWVWRGSLTVFSFHIMTQCSNVIVSMCRCVLFMIFICVAGSEIIVCILCCKHSHRESSRSLYFAARILSEIWGFIWLYLNKTCIYLSIEWHVLRCSQGLYLYKSLTTFILFSLFNTDRPVAFAKLSHRLGENSLQEIKLLNTDHHNDDIKQTTVIDRTFCLDRKWHFTVKFSVLQ